MVNDIWLGAGKHIIVYYVAGKRLVNFVANIEQDSWTGESWTDRGDVNDLRIGFANGIANCAPSSTPLTRRLYGAFSTVRRCSIGQWAG